MASSEYFVFVIVEDGEHHDDEDEDGDDDDHDGDVARDHAVVQYDVLAAAAAAAGPGAGQQLLLHVRLGDQLGGGRDLGRGLVIYCPW